MTVGAHPDEHVPNPTVKPPQNGTSSFGYGVDADPARRPMVPMELPSDVTAVRGPVGARQVPNMKIHKSTEHPDLTPVFGTSCPPRGLSGKLRDFAFTYSEGRMPHWLILLLADRIDVVEGMIEDVTHGKIPNTYKERGWDAPGATQERMRRNTHVATAVGVGLAIGAAVMLWPRIRDRRG